MNMHLMYTSYFLLISAIFIMAYSTIRYRNSSKNTTKNKVWYRRQNVEGFGSLYFHKFLSTSLVIKYCFVGALISHFLCCLLVSLGSPRVL